MITIFKYLSFVITYFMACLAVNAQEQLDSAGCIGNSFGFINVKEKSKNIAPIYCDAHPFSEGLAAVKNQTKWGFIDVDNNAVIPFQYDGAQSFKNEIAIIRQGEFYGVIDKHGTFVIPPVYFDLIPYELEGKQYYISRDSSFFQGIIDSSGEEILPHRYTYIITFESIIKTAYKYYDNLPFYTVFQEIDSTKGSFYEQFKEDAFQFSPEKGRHDIYDLQFDKLTSKSSTNYTDGFQHAQLLRMDAFLKEHKHQSIDQKIKAIDSILARPELPIEKSNADPRSQSYGRMTPSQVETYVKDLGYSLFKQDGKTGLKKRDKTVLPAQYNDLQFVNGVIQSPPKEIILFLKEHYGGNYRNQKDDFFDVFVVIPSGDSTAKLIQYSLSGEILVPVEQSNETRKKILTQLTPLGFLYLHVKNVRPQTTADEESARKTYSLVDWKGNELLAPLYSKIHVLESKKILVAKQVMTVHGMEEQSAILGSNGEEIVSLGMYSDVKPFGKSAENFYLAVPKADYPSSKAGKNLPPAQENRLYAILKVAEHAVSEVATFSANTVYPASLDAQSSMLRYKKVADGHE